MGAKFTTLTQLQLKYVLKFVKNTVNFIFKTSGFEVSSGRFEDKKALGSLLELEHIDYEQFCGI